MVYPSLMHSFMYHVMAILFTIVIVPAFIHIFIDIFAEEIKTIRLGLFFLLYGLEQLTSED